MFFSQDAFAPLSAIFFWVALWLGWPGHLQGWKPKAGYVLLQLFFCFTFILLTDWIVPRFYYALIDFRLFKVFCLVLFGFWLKVGYLAFDWIAKRF